MPLKQEKQIRKFSFVSRIDWSTEGSILFDQGAKDLQLMDAICFNVLWDV